MGKIALKPDYILYNQANEPPPISYVQEMGGGSMTGGFMFRALLALNKLKP